MSEMDSEKEETENGDEVIRINLISEMGLPVDDGGVVIVFQEINSFVVSGYGEERKSSFLVVDLENFAVKKRVEGLLSNCSQNQSCCSKLNENLLFCAAEKLTIYDVSKLSIVESFILKDTHHSKRFSLSYIKGSNREYGNLLQLDRKRYVVCTKTDFEGKKTLEVSHGSYTQIITKHVLFIFDYETKTIERTIDFDGIHSNTLLVKSSRPPSCFYFSCGHDDDLKKDQKVKSSDYQVVLYNFEKNEIFRVFKNHKCVKSAGILIPPIINVMVTTNNDRKGLENLIVGGKTGVLYIYNNTDTSTLLSRIRAKSSITSLIVLENKYLVVGDSTGGIQMGKNYRKLSEEEDEKVVSMVLLDEEFDGKCYRILAKGMKGLYMIEISKKKN